MIAWEKSRLGLSREKGSLRVLEGCRKGFSGHKGSQGLCTGFCRGSTKVLHVQGLGDGAAPSAGVWWCLFKVRSSGFGLRA